MSRHTKVADRRGALARTLICLALFGASASRSLGLAPPHGDTGHTPAAASGVRPVAGREGSGLAYVDAAGRPRILLGTTRHGLGLSIYDRVGVPRGLIGFKGGGIGFRLWNRRALPRADVTLRFTTASFGVYTRQGTVRSALVLGWSRSAAAFFARSGELRAAAALGEYFPVLGRFDRRGRLVREPVHHALPSLFVEAVKTSVGFVVRLGRHAGAAAADGDEQEVSVGRGLSQSSGG